MSRKINVSGIVTSITYPAHGCPVYLDVIVSIRQDESDIADQLLVRFLGRKKMGCLEIGVKVRLRGALTCFQGTNLVLNPAITVLESVR